MNGQRQSDWDGRCHLCSGVIDGAVPSTFLPVVLGHPHALGVGAVHFVCEVLNPSFRKCPVLLSFCSCTDLTRSISTRPSTSQVTAVEVSPGRQSDPVLLFLSSVYGLKGPSPPVWPSPSPVIISSLCLLPLAFGKRREASSTEVPSVVVNPHRQLDWI